MGKHRKSLGVHKAATAGGRNGKGAGGIPLTGKDHHKSLGVNKAANAGGKRSGGGAGSAMGATCAGSGGAGSQGWVGASAFSPTYQSNFTTAEIVTKTTVKRRTELCMRFSPGTEVKVTDEYYHEEENRCSFEDVAFAPANHGTIGMAEYYDEEENRGLSWNERDIEDDAKLLPYKDNCGAEMGGYGDYNNNAWVGDDGAEAGIGDDILNGDYYNYVSSGLSTMAMAVMVGMEPMAGGSDRGQALFEV
ncbi:unnamed protein product [Alopecurus aequalis]